MCIYIYIYIHTYIEREREIHTLPPGLGVAARRGRLPPEVRVHDITYYIICKFDFEYTYVYNML